MLDYIVNKTSHKMASYLKWNELELAKFYLGMKVLIHDVVMIIGIALLSYKIGTFEESCIIFIAFGFLRLKAGGYHCKESWQCFFCTSFIVIGGALFARHMHGINVGKVIITYLVLCVIASLIAPQGTKIRPIALDIKKKMKWETEIILIGYMFASVLLGETIGNLLLIAAVFEIVSLIPLIIINFCNYSAEHDFR